MDFHAYFHWFLIAAVVLQIIIAGLDYALVTRRAPDWLFRTERGHIEVRRKLLK
jgi:hypothetical protein